MAGFFDQSFIDEVLNRNDIVDVVSSYVRLERRGSKHWGRCPFHNEKTPSFSVDAQKQMFYCFGCHKGGNVITFLRERERLDFADAVEALAERAGMEIPKKGTPIHREVDREALYDACRKAALFYHQCLYAPQGKKALEYLHNRGLNDSLIRRFGLGYAPEGNALLAHLEGLGVSHKNMELTCLAMQKEGRRFDFFRNRVMFPIIDRRGRVIAFGGRVMDSSQPKYLNTPETILYKKRDQLYGINLLGKVQGLTQALIVEGYMDVVSLNAAGINYAVASLGTALTENQARLIKRYTQNVLIGYDGDAAGQRGMLRGLDILRAEGLRVRVLRLKDGMDPDDFARAYGRVGVEDAVEAALPLNDYVIDLLKGQYPLDTPDGRGSFVTACCRDVLCKLESPVEYDVYKGIVSRISGVSPAAIDEETARARRGMQAETETAPAPNVQQRLEERPHSPAEKESAAVLKAQDALLRIAVSYPARRAMLMQRLKEEHFTPGGHREIFAALGANPQAGAQQLLEILSGEGASELSRILLEETPEGDETDKLAQDCLNVLQINVIDSRINAIRDELKEHLADTQGRKALLEQQFALIREKKKLQEQRR